MAAFASVIIAAVIFGSIKGFDELKDKTLGNEMRSLSEGRWIKSEYGSPSIIIETPKVLVRTVDSLVPKSAVIKRKSLFTYGRINDPLYVRVSTVKFSQEQQLELESSLDMSLALLEKAGAKNLVVKRDDFETESGIKGIKAYGDFHVQVSENKVLKKKSSYELLLFAQENGLQEVLVVYQDDSRFSEAIKDRIINSIELELLKKKRKRMSSNFEFVNPQLFWLLLVLPLLLLWFFWKRKQQTAVLKISSLKGFDTSKNWLAKLRPLLFVLRLITLALIIVAMARPRTVDESTRIKTTKGIDIVIAIDVSASMLARDLKPNRLEALKVVASSLFKHDQTIDLDWWNMLERVILKHL